MRTSEPLPLLAAVAEALDQEDLAAVGDAALAIQLRSLWTAIIRLQAQVSRRIAVVRLTPVARPEG